MFKLMKAKLKNFLNLSRERHIPYRRAKKQIYKTSCQKYCRLKDNMTKSLSGGRKKKQLNQ